MSAVDFTPVILAQLTDLALRVTTLEASNNALKAEVERLTGNSLAVKSSLPTSSISAMKTSVPLTPKMSQTPIFASAAAMATPPPRTNSHHYEERKHKQPYQKPSSKPDHKPEYKQMTIQDVLEKDETVTIQIGTGKDDSGNYNHTTCITTFDGVNLVVKECELVPSLVGTSTSKPGEILYKFKDELLKNGHLKRDFSSAPWKLCFVERNGKRQSLEDLRA